MQLALRHWLIMCVCSVACRHETSWPMLRADELIRLPRGLSDLTLDDHNHLWAIAERDRIVMEISLGDRTVAPQITLRRLDGVPKDLDTEAITFLGEGKFAIGTEGQKQGSAGVMFGELGLDGHIRVTSTLSLSDKQVGVQVQRNNGAESLCGSGAELVVGIETTGCDDQGRYAPLVRLSGVVPGPAQKLRLTSEKGKLAALTCVVAADGSFELFAIERDLGVMRILHARADAGQREIQPELIMDLWPMARDKYLNKLNLEGIARLRDGRIVVVNDNDNGDNSRSVDTRLLFLYPDAPPKRQRPVRCQNIR